VLLFPDYNGVAAGILMYDVLMALLNSVLVFQ